MAVCFKLGSSQIECEESLTQRLIDTALARGAAEHRWSNGDKHLTLIAAADGAALVLTTVLELLSHEGWETKQGAVQYDDRDGPLRFA